MPGASGKPGGLNNMMAGWAPGALGEIQKRDPSATITSQSHTRVHRGEKLPDFLFEIGKSQGIPREPTYPGLEQ